MSIIAKYFCDGPQGHFYCDDLELARKLVNLIDNDDDWTITELPLDGVDELPTVADNTLYDPPSELMYAWACKGRL